MNDPSGLLCGNLHLTFDFRERQRLIQMTLLISVGKLIINY